MTSTVAGAEAREVEHAEEAGREPRTPRRWRPSRSAVWVFVATVLGLYVRWTIGGGAGYPPGDGGIFLLAVEAIEGAGYALPETIRYNGIDIPFAYPPLTFYLAAALSLIPGIDAIDTLVAIPLVASALVVPAVYLLGRRLLRDELSAVLAAFVAALLPVHMLISGGSITRGPGLLFALVGLALLLDALRAERARRGVWPALALAAAVLSHPEAAWFAAFSAALFVAAVLVQSPREAWPRILRRSAAIAGGVALLTAPWLALVLARYGAEPLLAAASTGGWSPLALVVALVFDTTGEPLTEVFAVLALIGVFKSIRDRSLLLPLWLLAIFVFDPRKGPIMSGPVIALLAGRGIGELVVPALDGAWPRPRGRPAGTAVAFIVAVMLLGSVGAIASANVQPAIQPTWLERLSEDNREAMEWARANTSPDARFAVLSDARNWAGDEVVEWFPALADRVSVATVQGTEWLPGEFEASAERYDDLARCRFDDPTVECLEAWEQQYGMSITHVYLSGAPPDESRSPCCRFLAQALEASPGFRLVFESGDVAVFERIGTPPGGG